MFNLLKKNVCKIIYYFKRINHIFYFYLTVDRFK
ncbi:hypothetical protein EZS27_027104 [termite gut metagenome]|uniref:Uncharacterized protein n=1 Tax=termite gut metagenome TaxID=433724 RepID=A0A5J4QNF4_9ZZZZ